MRRREFIGLVGGAMTAWPLVARAQQTKVYKIGWFGAGTATPVPRVPAAFSEALRELGWIEGKNILFEYRYADNRLERLPELAAELVRLHVDVIVAAGTLAPLAAKQATSTIPIVMTSAGDPIGSGLVANLARPGGNVTGLSLMSPDLGAKRLQMLKELLPGLTRVAVLWNAANVASERVFRETEGAARILGIEVYSVEVRSPTDLDNAYEAVTRQLPDALITVADPLIMTHRNQIAEFAVKKRLPSMSAFRVLADAGALMTYGADLNDLLRRAASYMDKVLKGANPADMAIEQPTKFELVINLKTAKTLGVTIPPALLARADEVIE
jgi:putative tryptophan/tyrosine transport system substrate-binding protein